MLQLRCIVYCCVHLFIICIYWAARKCDDCFLFVEYFRHNGALISASQLSARFVESDGEVY